VNAQWGTNAKIRTYLRTLFIILGLRLFTSRYNSQDGKTFFSTGFPKVFKFNGLASYTPNCCPQNMVKEGLTDKVFWIKDLADPN